MRKVTVINENWKFKLPNQAESLVNLPHTWNGIDGQDGGNDYLRTVASYFKTIEKPVLNDGERVVIEFDAVNSVATLIVNGTEVLVHKGGYSRFNADITDLLKDGENLIEVKADNRDLEDVYPSAADFTFYGGIYRDVKLYVLPKEHFNFRECASFPLKITPVVSGTSGILKIEDVTTSVENPTVIIKVFDMEGNEVLNANLNDKLTIENVHLWNGLKDPYLYEVKAQLVVDGDVKDEVSTKVGFRTFKVSASQGFILNGKPYSLRGVARHQDRPKKGNAISREDMEEDIKIILELGVNTVRLAHYQHDDYFYELCDKYGLVVWAEIPYISKYLAKGDQNTFDQMKDLIYQNYNHCSIVCWGVSNEITMYRKEFGKATRENHKKLNDFCHKEDPTRLTTVACFSMMTIFNRICHITDLASYNLYWGWYVPFTPVTNWILDMYHFFYPKSPIGLSEYGAEGMPNLHSSHPRRFDNTEEYQAIYHEKMLKGFAKRKYIWATHVWNMFDFGSDGRNQGGEKGLNHKGLVTFDRKIKKDAYYIYKAYFSDQPFVHITSKRFINRTGSTTKVKVYTNQSSVTLFNNGKEVATKTGDKVITFKLKMEDVNNITVKCGDLHDEAVIKKVSSKDPSYILQKGGNNRSWQK